MDLPGGKPVEFLIGFTNKGPNDFVVETVEASFRYPMDFNYYIQNFSAVAYNREVKSGLEATISYSFMPSDQFAGRPFGLNIAMNYRDSNGVQYMESVFNETVLISEVDEGLDGETFFLYVLMAGIVVLLLVVGQQYLLGSSGKRKRTATKKTIETGTANDDSIDYEWLPQETLRALRKFIVSLLSTWNYYLQLCISLQKNLLKNPRHLKHLLSPPNKAVPSKHRVPNPRRLLNNNKFVYSAYLFNFTFASFFSLSLLIYFHF